MFTPVHWLICMGAAVMVGLMSLASDQELKKSTGYLYSVLFLETIGFGVALDGRESTFTIVGLVSLAATGFEIWWRKSRTHKPEENSN